MWASLSDMQKEDFFQIVHAKITVMTVPLQQYKIYWGTSKSKAIF